MASYSVYTDLAFESREIRCRDCTSPNNIPGVRFQENIIEGYPVQLLEITDSDGERELGKPAGKYFTLNLGSFLRKEQDAFQRGCSVISGILRKHFRLRDYASLLVVGLGNRNITPDSLGPAAVDNILITRHLIASMPEDFSFFRPVSALCSGVLGTTGIESGKLVSSVCACCKPDCVIAIDALASHKAERLCRVVQISDTGIIPGSGVGNAREGLTRSSLDVPVISLGVPTVVEAGALSSDLAERSGVSVNLDLLGEYAHMIVTPKDIDRNISELGRLLGYSINLAFQEGLSFSDMEMFSAGS